MICPKCQKEIQEEDSYCKFCGANLKEDASGQWYFRGWLVFFLVFFVGPFALPLIYANPKLSKRTKGILTTIILTYTLILLLIPHLVLRKIYSNILSMSAF